MDIKLNQNSLVSKLVTDQYTYVNLHMEQIYNELVQVNSTKGMANRDLAVIEDSRYQIENKNYIQECNTLKMSTLERIDYDIKQIKGKVVIDFKGINIIQQNLLPKLRELLSNLEDIITINVPSGYKEELLSMSAKDSEIEHYEQAYKRVLKKMCIEELLIEYPSKERESDQSGIILEKYFDIKILIESQKEFFKAIYYMAFSLNEYINKYKKDESEFVKLFCHTLNGAAIASMIGCFLNLDTLYIDHLGPNNSLQKSRFNNSNEHQYYFIVITDVVCLGHEIERAKNVVALIGGEISKYVSVITLEAAKIKQENQLLKLVYISSEEALQVGYSIKTKFCCKEKE